MGLGLGDFEILKLDDSCISNPEIRNMKLDSERSTGLPSNLLFRISGFEMQESSNFKISKFPPGTT
jgi:hypothetical protein